jgi:hypothetical protein
MTNVEVRMTNEVRMTKSERHRDFEFSGFDIRHSQCPNLDSNQDHDLRRVGCDPLHHRDGTRADGGIRTRMIRFTRPAPC